MPFPDADALIKVYFNLGWKPQLPIAAAELRLLARLTEVVNVNDFGADPTGVADSTAAINNAIAALGVNSTLAIPAGSYTILGQLNPIPGNCSVMGVGEFATTLNSTSNSGTFWAMNSPNSTLTNLTINNSSTQDTASALSLNANQLTVQNVTITGFGGTAVNMTANATFANVFNVFVSSSQSGSVGMNVAGSDTEIQGCTFSGLATGITCAATDRFSIVDNVFANCTTGVSITNTSATGTTTFDGCVFDACTTGVSVTPGTSQAVQAVVLDGCAFDGCGTGVSLAPTSTGTLNYLTMDGCSIIATAANSKGIVVNGAASSVNYVIIDGCTLAVSGTSSVGFTYTAGGTAAKPISLMNCMFNSTTNSSPVPGAGNTQPFVFRACPPVNPVGVLTSQPAAVSTAQTNNSGCDVMLALSVGSTATTFNINGTASGFGSLANSVATVILPYNQNFTLSQITGVAVTWVGS